MTTNYCDYDEKGSRVMNNACGHGITLSRLIDGIDFFGNDLVEDFYLELGSNGKIRNFCLTWSELAPLQSAPIATSEQITACVRAFKTALIPGNDEPNYFARLKSLAKAKKLTITKIPRTTRKVFMENNPGTARSQSIS